jgi:hypothetical protein
MQDDRHLLPGYGLTVVKIAACRRGELPFPAKTIASEMRPYSPGRAAPFTPRFD